eukprot:gene11433-12626_t
MIQVENFINGKFIPASQFLDSFDPSTGKVHAQIPRSGKSDVEAAVAAADNARKGWSSTPVATRSSLMMKVADLLEANLDMFAKAESKDQGKPISLSRAVDIPRAVHNFRFFATAILHFGNVATSQDHLDALSYTVHCPVGIVGQITPWNLPLYLLTFKIAPAIAAGNCVICKPSELTSVTAWMLCSIFNEAGIPPGVINMVFGSGAEVGAEIVENPNICAISFTGSTGVGHYIQEKSAPFCKKLSLELGGKNSAIVFDDANLDACIQTCVRSSFANQGEICLCTSRIYVHRSIFDTFVKRFVEKTRSLKVGPPENDDVFMGALVSKDHLEKVKRYVQLAIEEGGTILCGEGKDELPDLPDANKQGYFMLPTAVMGLADDARCMQEEVFGPFVCITQFDTEEEVIKRVNNVTYGLCSTLWTESGQRIHRVAPQLEVGTIWCNCWLVRDLNMPFGGFKQSGIGREGFKDSLEFYTEVKTICVKTSY